MAKTQDKKPVCGKCMEPIDQWEVRNAILLKQDYMHGCGKWLVRGGGNAEVPTSSLDDDLAAADRDLVEGRTVAFDEFDD